MNSHKKTTNKKYNLKTIVITLVGIIVIIIAVIALSGLPSKNSGNNTEVTQAGPTVNIDDVFLEGEYLDISLGDCTLYVGATLQLECNSNPENLAQNVVWSSAYSDIVSVTNDGVINVLKEGTTAITAVSGVYSDSIIVNVIAEDETAVDSGMGLPIYNVVDGNVVEVNPSNPTNVATEAQGTEAGDSPEQTEAQTEATAPTQATTTAPQETTETTEDIAAAVVSSGFRPYLEDVYLYEEDNNYLGQLIIYSRWTQIYIMTRTTTFDAAIKELLKYMLPEGYESTFASFTSATKDQTLASDGHIVRIVTSANGGHSQIIIYQNGEY